MSISLVICDQEEAYAKALAAYLMRRKECPFSVQVCSSPPQIRRIQEKEDIGILLLHDAFPSDEREGLKAGCRILLTESLDRPPGEWVTLYRLQSGDRILAGILEAWGNGQKEFHNPMWLRGTGKSRIIGVFSPVHRSGRTSWAIRKGEELSFDAQVLYLNLELYGGVGGIFPKEGYTLADALYYSRQEGKNLGWMLASMVSHMGNLDYLLPARISEDIRRVTAQEWRRLVSQIIEEGMYDIVILDIDEGLSDCYEILRMCTEIWMPVLSDETAQAKLAQLDEELRLLGYDDVRRRLQKTEVIR